MYFFDLRSPILEAFFFTASVGRLSFEAIFAVGLLGKSFLSRLNSPLDHKPLMSFFFAFFFAIAYPFELFGLMAFYTLCCILMSDGTIIKHFFKTKKIFFRFS